MLRIQGQDAGGTALRHASSSSRRLIHAKQQRRDTFHESKVAWRLVAFNQKLLHTNGFVTHSTTHWWQKTVPGTFRPIFSRPNHQSVRHPSRRKLMIHKYTFAKSRFFVLWRENSMVLQCARNFCNIQRSNGNFYIDKRNDDVEEFTSILILAGKL